MLYIRLTLKAYTEYSESKNTFQYSLHLNTEQQTYFILKYERFNYYDIRAL
jgi:hypothetical protein